MPRRTTNEHDVIKRMAKVFGSSTKRESVRVAGESSLVGGQEPPAQSGMKNPMTAIGDLIRGGLSGAAVRIPIGTEGQILTVIDGKPQWADQVTYEAVTDSSANVLTDNDGNIVYAG